MKLKELLNNVDVLEMTADPELKQTLNGKSVASFSIAINRRYQNEGEKKADFINVVAWNKKAEFIAKYFRKGMAICIVGSIQSRSWVDQNGQKRYTTEVIAEEANFVESKSDGQTNQPAYVPEAYTFPAGAPNFEEISPEDVLPF